MTARSRFRPINNRRHAPCRPRDHERRRRPRRRALATRRRRFPPRPPRTPRARARRRFVPAERLLHERLVVEPTRAVDAGELAAIADGDARENYATFFAFRDAVERAGTLEAHYLALVRGGRIALPPVFLDRMVAAIVAPLVDGDADVFERRAAQ